MFVCFLGVFFGAFFCLAGYFFFFEILLLLFKCLPLFCQKGFDRSSLLYVKKDLGKHLHFEYLHIFA